MTFLPRLNISIKLRYKFEIKNDIIIIIMFKINLYVASLQNVRFIKVIIYQASSKCLFIYVFNLFDFEYDVIQQY